MHTLSSELPEPIRMGILRFSDQTFWARENIDHHLKHSPGFGSVVALGFDVLLNSRMQENTIGYHAVQMWTRMLMKDNWPLEGRIDAAISLRELSQSYYGMRPEQVSIHAVLAASYLRETKFLQECNWRAPDYPPKSSMFILEYDEALTLSIFRAEHEPKLVERGTEILRRAFA